MNFTILRARKLSRAFFTLKPQCRAQNPRKCPEKTRFDWSKIVVMRVLMRAGAPEARAALVVAASTTSNRPGYADPSPLWPLPFIAATIFSTSAAGEKGFSR